MVDKKVNKASQSKKAKVESKVNPKIVDKKKITKGTEKKSRRAQKESKTVKDKSIGSGLSAPAFDINGRSLGKVILSREIFGQKPNEKLLAQAIYIYSTNQSTHAGSTKTRSETRGGGRKPWRQKGTGRARAGSIRSPLWVGGGVALGPKHRNVTLSLPKKMKRQALILALSSKTKSGDIKIISNIEKIEPKTKIITSLLDKLQISKNTLLVISATNQNVKLATRNIQRLTLNQSSNLNAFEIIENNNILFSKDALANLSSLSK